MKVYGLLGRNISYSFSRSYFEEKFKKENLQHEYKNFDLNKINELKKVIKNPEIQGLNVTIPYKEEILPYLDELDPIAKEIGAVNVIKFCEGQKLKGYNSDYFGFMESLKPLLNDTIKKALILGTGGASKAIAYALKELGINHVNVSRNPDFKELNYTDLNKEIIQEHKIIINCTPLGTYPDVENHPDIPYEYLTNDHILFDLIYNPQETTFMKKGREKNAKVSNGLQMLIFQAERTGKYGVHDFCVF